MHPLSNSSIHPSTCPSSQLVICPSICLLTNPFIHSSIHPPSVYQSIHRSNHPSVHASIQPPIHPSTHPLINPSNHLFIYPSIHPSVHLSIHPSIQTSFLPPPIPSSHPSFLRRTLRFCAYWYFIPLKFNHRVFLFLPAPSFFGLHPFSAAVSSRYTDSFANNNSGELLASDSLTELFYYLPCFSWYFWFFQVGHHIIFNQWLFYFPLSATTIIIDFSCLIAHSRTFRALIISRGDHNILDLSLTLMRPLVTHHYSVRCLALGLK